MRWNGLCLALDLAVNEPAQYCKTCPITQEVYQLKNLYWSSLYHRLTCGYILKVGLSHCENNPRYGLGGHFFQVHMQKFYCFVCILQDLQNLKML